MNVKTGVQNMMAELLPSGTCLIALNMESSSRPPNMPCITVRTRTPAGPSRVSAGPLPARWPLKMQKASSRRNWKTKLKVVQYQIMYPFFIEAFRHLLIFLTEFNFGKWQFSKYLQTKDCFGNSLFYLDNGSMQQKLPKGESGHVKLLNDVGGRERESGAND